jgi:hypothetical protein
MTPNTIIAGDCLEVMRSWPDKCVDLVCCSPPYENCRKYAELEFNLSGQDWVDWMFVRIKEMVRICKGLVVVNCEGKTKNYRYSCTPFLLMADLHRSGFNLRKPAVFHRVGIPGSGGPDWIRNDWEPIICITPPGKLSWSDSTACGHPPKWAPGGEMSNRLKSGARVNQWGDPIGSGATVTDSEGVTRSHGKRPSHVTPSQCQRENGEDGSGSYDAPAIANPGNVLSLKVGGGLMGSKLSHENEAPFPETFAEFWVKSFCPPAGIVLDPFCGSFTVGAVAVKNGRQYVGIDQRQSQVDLSERRVIEARKFVTASQTLFKE